MYGHQPGGRMGHSPRRVDMETGQCDEFNLLHKLAGQGRSHQPCTHTADLWIQMFKTG
jgi:hypothetical protein